MEGREPPSRLARRLGLRDATFVGLGAMLGAGVFAALGAAAGAAGSGALVGLALAALVALLNAYAVARLAPLHPESGGAYAYGRARLGAGWGFLAGWGFVAGKLASCAAMALTVGAYAAPGAMREVAVAAVVAATVVNLCGVDKTAAATRLIVVVVLASLATVVGAAFGGGAASLARLADAPPPGPLGVLRSAGILFFAFAGYARIATLGEEVRDPARTIPRAIAIALGVTLAVYASVLVAALASLPIDELAAAPAPLVAVVESGRLAALAPAARVGAVVASFGVLLSLLAGVSRTAFAMAARGDLPAPLAAVHPRTRVPHRAELAAGALIVVVVLVSDVRAAIGFSSFTVLVYYAIANGAAATLPRPRGPVRALAPCLGVAGCLLLALTLPASSVQGGIAALLVGMVLRAARRALPGRAG